ncbi:MAG: cation transporting ATPase C-terminal domain-containing protein [Candidatus Peregrinibacteria bacterium]
MIQEILLHKAIPLLLSATPLSLILVQQFSKFFSKSNLKIGSTTIILTNLTQTLTEPDLIVRTIYFDKYKMTFEDDSNFAKIEDPDLKDEKKLVKKTALKEDENIQLIAASSTLCKFEKTKNLEEVITRHFTNCGINRHKIEKDYETIDKIPGLSAKKLSTVVVQNTQTKEIFSFTKGHPAKVLRKCTKVLYNGKKIELTPPIRRKLRKKIKQLIKNGQKTIGTAYKPLPRKKQENYTAPFAENEMTFTGMIGITSPIKQNLEISIDLAKKAGIKTYITTREKEKKAIAIGKKLNLINPHYYEAITGPYLKKIPDQKLIKMFSNKEKDYVFSELTDDDKKRIKQTLKQMGEIVTATDPKTKDTYRTLVEKIRQGRQIFKNYTKIYNHALSCKIAEFILILTAIILRAPTPLSIALILIIDIIINLILELAIRQEKSEKAVMTKDFKPAKQSIPKILLTGVLIGVFLTGAYFWNLLSHGWTLNTNIPYTNPAFTIPATITFILLVLIQIIRPISLKKPYSLLTAIITLLLLYIIVGFSAFIEKLNLSTLSKIEWSLIAYLTLLLILVKIVFYGFSKYKKRLPAG